LQLRSENEKLARENERLSMVIAKAKCITEGACRFQDSHAALVAEFKRFRNAILGKFADDTRFAGEIPDELLDEFLALRARLADETKRRQEAEAIIRDMDPGPLLLGMEDAARDFLSSIKSKMKMRAKHDKR
jgi:hypothetical protein